MYKFQIRIWGNGILVNAKKISPQKANFWNKKKSSDLTNYLLNGDNDLNFKVPKYAEFLGSYAEHESNLKLRWSHDNLFSGIELTEIYGPNIRTIDKIDFFDVINDRIVWSIKSPNFDFYTLSEDFDNDLLSVGLEVSNNNLLILQSEKGCWIYESDALVRLESVNELKLIATNCSFDEEIDSLLDDICFSFVFKNNFFRFVDADTETLANLALVYID